MRKIPSAPRKLEPLSLKLNREIPACGVIPEEQLLPGTATPISTGGVLPRGADGVVMIENTHPDGDRIRVLKPIVPEEESPWQDPIWVPGKWYCAGRSAGFP